LKRRPNIVIYVRFTTCSWTGLGAPGDFLRAMGLESKLGEGKPAA